MGAVMTDIAFSPSGTLFGVTPTDLYRIDPDTAASAFVGSLGVDGSNALEFDLNGTLFMAMTNSTLLRTVDTITGATTVVGDMGVSSSGDLAFDPSSGNLFLSTPLLTSVTDELYRVNPSTAASTKVGDIGFESVFGMDFSGGTLFGLTNGGELITVNTMSGTGTLVANTGVAAFGASGAPQSSDVDSDGDGFTDEEERARGFNPLDPRSPKVPVLLVHGWCSF
jgi:sugar lactone lactonase YvrE